MKLSVSVLSISKMFARFVRMNTFNVDELKLDYAAAGYIILLGHVASEKLLSCRCRTLDFA